MRLLAGAAALVAMTSFPALAENITAIDVLIRPGPKMLSEAADWNARLREQSPEGFELDAEHAPHVTLVQQFVATEDIDEVLAAVAEVKTSFDVRALQMTATGLYHIPSGEIGLAGIVIEPSPDLLALQRAVIDAVQPFSRSGGDETAFVPDASGMPFDPFLFEYVETFVPGSVGERYNPHVTVGIAPLRWLEDQEKQPFQGFSFGADGIAVYQLGNFGTASRRLDEAG